MPAIVTSSKVGPTPPVESTISAHCNNHDYDDHDVIIMVAGARLSEKGLSIARRMRNSSVRTSDVNYLGEPQGLCRNAVDVVRCDHDPYHLPAYGMELGT